MQKGRNPDVSGPEVEPSHRNDGQDVVNRSHHERAQDRALGVFAHRVEDRSVPETPKQAEQKQTPKQAELTDQPVLRVDTPAQFLSECEWKRDHEIESHVFDKLEW